MSQAATSPASNAAAQAEEAVRLLGDDPGRARALAQEALDGARAAGDDETVAVALRALGLAALDLEGAPQAVEQLRDAVAAAARAGVRRRLAQARMSLAHALQQDGQSSAALRLAGLALKEDEAAADARLRQQHALILERLGRLDEALEGYRIALALARRARDAPAEVLALLNRGVVQIYRGALRAAEADLREAEALARAGNQPLRAAMALNNLGLVATLRGDLPEALACFDAAEPVVGQASQTLRAIMGMDRCRALLAAGLRHEALSSAAGVVELLERCAIASELAEARLTLAEAALAGGDPAAALAAAEQAAADFRAQRRPAWAALSENVAVRAAFAGGARDAALRIRARRSAEALERAGRPAEALDARVLAARVALALGRGEEAARDLQAIGHARRAAPVTQRLAAWHAEALRRLACGQRAGALRALRAGLAVLDAHRVSVGATELRTGAAVHGNALTALGLSLALRSGRAPAVLEWAERGRAGALWQRPARPPDDAALAADLAELRALLSAIDGAALQSRDTQRLLRRQAELEASVRRRARHAVGAGVGRPSGPPPARELRAALGERVLVEYVLDDGELLALVADRRAIRLRRLGVCAGDAQHELAALRSALRKLARGSRSAASLQVAHANSTHACRRLDELLLAPLRADLGGSARELVLVPTGELHALPWAVLPTCAGRALSVAPSAALWLRAARRRTLPAAHGGDERLLLAAGPGLAEAEAEVRALAARHGDATALLGSRSTVERVAAALESATRAHIASHGTFRADNPLFSALQLADGPLTVYDLERLRAAPRDMILSACDGGVAAVRPGDELMGFSGALLALGTSALIASVVPVPDEPTHRLMLALHARLAAGAEPAAALAAASASALDPASPADYATAAGFVCFGAGSPA